ncbi:hypothetical protein Nepgr_015494 [Nepenthes gracilis]|uniref:Epidermal patterning factor-like protein n=1 Tax=Nepenthes gracilis TaxID=150966 RepID=A0AAD3SL96_NEPGR|nr:hypothetical protein Nepgr_015494 [Nepenthes gracilis]
MGEKKKITEVSFIGSGPPKCERRCAYCVHCEAVQVPISAPHKQGLKPAGAHFLHSTPTTVNSRADDDDSNYKPISWKCKCGDFIFNP